MIGVVSPVVLQFVTIGLLAVSVTFWVVTASAGSDESASTYDFLIRERGPVSILFGLNVFLGVFVAISTEFVGQYGLSDPSGTVAVVVFVAVGVALALGLLTGNHDSSAPIQFDAPTEEQRAFFQYAMRGVGVVIAGASLTVPTMTFLSGTLV